MPPVFLDRATATAPSGTFPVPQRDTTNWMTLSIPPATTARKVDGFSVNVVELRGWLRSHASECWKDDKSGPDWALDLEADPEWLDAVGISLDRLFRVGCIGRSLDVVPAVLIDGLKLLVRIPIVHVEVHSWKPGIENNGRLVHAGHSRPPDWDKRAACATSTFWPFHPSNPLPWQPPLAVGDYVRIVGSLITDAPHGGDPFDDFTLGESNPARWTEIHPPDIIERLPDKQRNETLQAVRVWAKPRQASVLDVDLPAPPRPPWAESLHVTEVVLPGTRQESIVKGNATKTGAALTVLGDRVHVHVMVSGTLAGAAVPAPGRFAAVYRVFWMGSRPVPLELDVEAVT